MKFLLTLVLVAFSTAQANEVRRFDTTVIEIVDGDTLWLGVGSQRIKTRLSGIDAREVSRGAQRGQPWGDEARAALARLAPLYTTATCRDSVPDAYGRRLCQLFINGLDVALELSAAATHGSTRDMHETQLCTAHSNKHPICASVCGPTRLLSNLRPGAATAGLQAT